MTRDSRIKIGDRFGRYTVVSKAESANGQSRYNMICDCGNAGVAYYSGLLRGSSTSCGCYRSEFHRKRLTTHDKSRSKIYKIWRSMLKRCYYTSYENFHNYGGRGIAVCPEWKDSFDRFFRDMGLPSKGQSLDRIDVDGNYCAENCRWATTKEQQRNKRNSKKYCFMGRMVTIGEAKEVSGSALCETTIANRLERGYSLERAVTEEANSKYVLENRRVKNKRSEKVYNVFCMNTTIEAAYNWYKDIFPGAVEFELVLRRVSDGWDPEWAICLPSKKWRPK